jgi:pimeloyl-ACP methyl ester carboxylesterase
MIRAEYVTIDGAVGFAEVAGEGAPLLCIHTAGQSGVQWREVLRELGGNGFQVIVPDLPGHGRSDNLLGGAVTDLSAYSGWLTELLAALEVVEPLVVGCSIGGKIALELAASGVVRPRAVVAMAADAYNPQLSLGGLRRSLEDSASPSRADRTYFGTLSSVGAAMPLDRALAVAAMHRREDPIVATSDLIGWSTHDLRDRLQTIACPVHLVAGEDDFWLDPAAVAWAAAQIPTGSFELLPGVGHYPMEELDGFPRQLVAWFNDLLSKRTER